jgi:N-acetylmuramoyl-L-alanine amidase
MRRSMRRSVLGGFLVLAFVCVTVPSALAAAGAVTLSASATTIDFGGSVRLTGEISPPAGGQAIDIVDATGAILTTTTTGGAGGFSVSLSPRANVTLHAVWVNEVSPDVTIGVRAVVTVHLGPVRLFDGAAVRGTVAPAVAGATVAVTLTRDGKAVADRSAVIGAAGGFRTTFPIEDPGTYRVRAAFADPDHLRGTATDGPASTSLPSLEPGSSGIFVLLLERRLVELQYRLVDIDRRYDFRTADAVIAFRKVQRMLRVSTVDAGVWRALAHPLRPHARSTTNGFHIEIDQTRQVLYTVQDGSVTNIMHVSTGKASTPTRDGSFSVTSKLAGYSDHQLYYPSFFDGSRAIHGWPDVPTYPASHGCVRVPYWNAKWIYRLAAIGTPVIVYH